MDELIVPHFFLRDLSGFRGSTSSLTFPLPEQTKFFAL